MTSETAEDCEEEDEDGEDGQNPVPLSEYQEIRGDIQ